MKKGFLKLQNINSSHKNCVLAYGHFTTIHTGHIRYLKYAKSRGKKLIVALLGDNSEIKNNKYAFNQIERAEALNLLSILSVIAVLINPGEIQFMLIFFLAYSIAKLLDIATIPAFEAV